MLKKILSIVFIVYSSLCIVSAQGVWSPRTSLPDSTRGEGISCSIGNYGYVGLGENYYEHPYKYYNDFWQFDPSTNSWIRKANFPGKARVWPATFVIGNYVYVVTGRDSALTNYLTECWQYNALTNKWTQKANFPGIARAYGVGFAIGGKGYVGLGHNTDYYKDFWVYDTATDSWGTIANFDGVSRWCASAFAVGSKGYVCLGQDSIAGNNMLKDLWAYDTGTHSWEQKSNYPGYPILCSTGFVIQNNIFIGTGQDSTGALDNKFWKYNTVTDSWASLPKLPGYSKAVCSAFSIVDTGYVGLGEDSTGLYFNTLYRFIPDSTTGIIQLINNGNDVLIYPNPFNEFCIVSVPQQITNSKAILVLYDLQGNSIKAIVKESGNNYTINRDGLQQGLYILSIQVNNQTIHKKLIITN